MRVRLKIPRVDFREISVLLTNTQNPIQVEDNIQPPTNRSGRGWEYFLYFISTHSCYLLRTMDRLLQSILQRDFGSEELVTGYAITTYEPRIISSTGITYTSKKNGSYTLVCDGLASS